MSGRWWLVFIGGTPFGWFSTKQKAGVSFKTMFVVWGGLTLKHNHRPMKPGVAGLSQIPKFKS